MNSQKGICVQIGLEATAEYLYLTQPSTEAPNPHKAIPKRLLHRYTQWQYYGVDCDPCSIAKMLENHHEQPNAEWIVSHISGHPKQSFIRYPTLFIEGRTAFFQVASMTLDSLLSYLSLKRVDVLALDIEGFELEVLENYAWEIKPAFMAIESHDNQHEAIEALLTEKGYIKTLDAATNIRDNIAYTRELHFLRDRLYP